MNTTEYKCIECDCIVPDSEQGYCYNCCEKIEHKCTVKEEKRTSAYKSCEECGGFLGDGIELCIDCEEKEAS